MEVENEGKSDLCSTSRIYLAARYNRREEICQYRKQLEDMDYRVVSRWLNGSHEITAENNSTGKHSRTMSAKFAEEDCNDLKECDTLITFTERPDVVGGVRGGRHVEFGMALVYHMRLIVVGPRENVFHYLEEVEHYNTWEECLTTMRETRYGK